MTTRIQRRLTTLEVQTVSRIEQRIESIEHGDDPQKILDPDDMQLFTNLGKSAYITHLQELRDSFIYEDFPSEE